MSNDQHVYVNGIHLCYRVQGTGSPLVIQAPGWGIGADFYEQTLAPLAQHNTVIAYDPRGSGRSEAPAHSEDINVGMMVEDLEALRADLRLESFALLGHSHGGYIALNYALKYGDRLSHLVLVDSQVGWPEVDADLQRNLPKLAAQERFAAAVEAWRSSKPLESDADFAAWLRSVISLYFYNPEHSLDLTEALKTHHPSLTAFRATLATDRQYAIRGRIDRLSMPTLAMVGRHDFIASPEQSALLTELGAELCVFEQSGHFPWLEEPESFFAAVYSWLASTPAESTATTYLP